MGIINMTYIYIFSGIFLYLFLTLFKMSLLSTCIMITTKENASFKKLFLIANLLIIIFVLIIYLIFISFNYYDISLYNILIKLLVKIELNYTIFTKMLLIVCLFSSLFIFIESIILKFIYKTNTSNIEYKEKNLKALGEGTKADNKMQIFVNKEKMLYINSLATSILAFSLVFFMIIICILIGNFLGNYFILNNII